MGVNEGSLQVIDIEVMGDIGKLTFSITTWYILIIMVARVVCNSHNVLHL